VIAVSDLADYVAFAANQMRELGRGKCGGDGDLRGARAAPMRVISSFSLEMLPTPRITRSCGRRV